MRHIYHLFPLFLFLACVSKNPEEEVIAIVNGREIKGKELKVKINSTLQSSLRDELRRVVLLRNKEENNKIKTYILTTLIDEYLVVEDGKKMGIDVSDEEVEEDLRKTFSGLPGGITGYIKMYTGLNLQNLKERTITALLFKKTLERVSSDIKVEDREIEEYYLSHKDTFYEPEKVRALQIVVKSYDKAKTLYELLTASQNPPGFEEVAKENSISPEAKDGGDLGYIAEEDLPEEFSVLFTLNPGEISKIVKSPYGYHIFKIIDKKPAREKTLDEVKEEIRKTIYKNKKEKIIKEYMSKLRAKADVRIKWEALTKLEIF